MASRRLFRSRTSASRVEPRSSLSVSSLPRRRLNMTFLLAFSVGLADDGTQLHVGVIGHPAAFEHLVHHLERRVLVRPQHHQRRPRLLLRPALLGFADPLLVGIPLHTH